MSSVSYTRRWLLYCVLAQLAAIGSIPAIMLAEAWGAPVATWIVFPAAQLLAIATLVFYRRAYERPTDRERGKPLRFETFGRSSPHLRVYDDLLVVRDTRAWRTRVREYAGQEIEDVELVQRNWLALPFLGRVRLQTLADGVRETFAVRTPQANELFDVVRAVQHEAQRRLAENAPENLPKRTAATSDGSS